ncbi:MAG: HEPN domain-containing protein [Caldilineae bacterium]|nr:MAG: HEPN domain-containing protein [Caldilineae bacterium]
MTAELELARQWLAKAQNDLLNADNNLAAEQIPYDTVCFHCQQAAEKLLKAALIASGQQPPRTHDLMVLLETIRPGYPEVEHLRNPLAILMPYAIEIRYPDDWFMPSSDDAREARDMAAQVLDWLRQTFPRLFQPGSA